MENPSACQSAPPAADGVVSSVRGFLKPPDSDMKPGSILVLSSTRLPAMTAALSGIYGFLYFVLQMQDYALSACTAALSGILAVVTYPARKVDWSNQAHF